MEDRYDGIHFPADPGPLFDGVLEVDSRHANREELGRRNATLATHDPHLYRDEKTGMYYTSASGPGGILRRSKDLVHWEYVGKGLWYDAPPEAKEWTYYSEEYQAGSVWAPEVTCVGGEYRMYYSVSTFGHRLSYIGLAVSDRPEGPYEERGAVIKTTEESPVNAIDPNLVIDHETGAHYLNYGSFWGGIRQIRIDPATGLRLEGNEPEYGRELWKRSHRADRAIEGALEVYNPDTGYYYLFVSYDSTLTDYNIRVARSRKIQGPFVDHRGVPVSHTHTAENPDAVGLKIVDCVQFGSHFGWAAAGHNGILRADGHYYISYHTRAKTNLKCAAQQIHWMIFDREGWPLVSPCQYSGEALQKIEPSAMAGTYERVVLGPPDGALCRQSEPMELKEDGSCTVDGTEGSWRMVSDYEFELCIGRLTERGYVLASYDVDGFGRTLALTARRSDGLCTWAKKRMEGCVCAGING